MGRKLRKFKYYIANRLSLFDIYVLKKDKTSFLEFFDKRLSRYDNFNDKSLVENYIKELAYIIEYIKENNLTDSDIEKIFEEARIEKDNFYNPLKHNGFKETRDNKGQFVSESYSSDPRIRFPSKKRSLSVWKKFYKMFPNIAKEDEFDGKTSKRMTKK